MENNQNKQNKQTQDLQQQAAQTTTPMVINFLDTTQFGLMQRVCRMYSQSEIVPELYKAGEKNTPEKAMANCMIALEMALRIGASPLAVMQNMSIIQGKPSWSAKFLISTVNTCGRYNTMKFKFIDKGNLGMVDINEIEKAWETNPATGRSYQTKRVVAKQFDGRNIKDIACVAYTTEKGSDEVLESPAVTVRMAVQEGWYTKSGSKWPTMTSLMLTYRAATTWVNIYAPELSMGMKTIEEQQDILEIDAEVIKDNSARNEPKRVNVDMDAAQEKKDNQEQAKAAEPEAQKASEQQPEATSGPGF